MIVLKEGGAKNPHVCPYRYPLCQKNEIEIIVDELLQSGVIKPSTSIFSSLVIVVKKEEVWRLCLDYKALKIIVLNKFLIPIIVELLDESGGMQIFSKLHLKSRYHQIQLNEDDIRKRIFCTHEGHYEFLVMPSGLTSSPSPSKPSQTRFKALFEEIFTGFL
ncbi:hypothetical protein S83_066399 [Arachis hypogaea]